MTEITPEVARGEAQAKWDPTQDAQFMKDLRTIKEGGQPVWEHTFEHPIHGPLTFRAKLPRPSDLTKHAVLMDNMLTEMGLAPGTDVRPHTIILVAARAGLQTLVELPVVDERRIDDDEVHGRIEKVLYDPEKEHDEFWLRDVWFTFSNWRHRFSLPEAAEALKNCSGGTPGSGQSEPSTEPTDAPPAIPA